MYKLKIIILCIVLILSILYHSYYNDNKEGYATIYRNGNDEDDGIIEINNSNDSDVLNKKYKYVPRKIFVVNLDKSKERYYSFQNEYAKTGLVHIPFTRFSAIDGSKIIPQEHLTDTALEELKIVEKNKYRTHHYQLTRGGIGCFLSHLELAKKLLNDKENDYYLVFEDDVELEIQCATLINDAIKNVPSNWDMLLLSTIRLTSENKNKKYISPHGFWGMACYVINKKGAKKLVDEVSRNKIDGQIDSYLSVMQQQGKIQIYAYHTDVVKLKDYKTNIQMKLIRAKERNPFMYKGYFV